MNEPCKVCLLSPAPPPIGGIARWTALLLAWAQDDPRIELTHLDIKPGWRAINDLALSKRILGGGVQLILDVVRLIRILASCRFDVVHITTSIGPGVLRDICLIAVSRAFRIPVFYHLHSGRLPLAASKNTLVWKLLVVAMSMTERVLVLDRASREVLNRRLPGVQVEQISNCINIDDLPQRKAHATSIRTAVFVGLNIPPKGLAELIAAWAGLKPRGWLLKIAGAGSDSYQQSLLSEYQPDNVEFLGQLPHGATLQLIADCDFFVLPSHTEGFPNVILEAMALGKAVLATNVGAIPEMLAEGCGLTVAPQQVEALRAALHVLTEDTQRRQRLGLRARERALEEYSCQAVFARLYSLWTEKSA